MKRTLILIAAMLLPLTAVAQTYTASLSGDNVVGGGAADGAGLAVVTFNGADVSYTILVSGTDSPTAAHIHEGAAGLDGSVVIDLNASFTAGTATGTVSASAAAVSAILSNPAGYYVNVHTGTLPGGAVRGQLEGEGGGTGVEDVVLYHPVVAKVGGLAGTNFVTDVRMVNRSGGEATVTVDFYRQGAGGHSAPSATATVTIPDGVQVVADDFAGSVLGQTSAQGAVVVTADRPITSSARIYNDQRDAGEGTFGQYSQAMPLSHGWSAGVLPFLSNDNPTSGAGYRSNIGWFNPNPAQISVTLRGYDAGGALLGTVTRQVAGYAQQQQNVASLWPALAEYGDFYVAYEVTGGQPVFMYASVVDNVNGDAIFVPAIP